MRKFLIISIVLITIFLVTGAASAWYRPHRHHHYGFGVFIGPPVIWAPPLYYRYPYYPDYSPPYGYYNYGYRVWVPGHWEERWTPYGWERVWIPGYWRYDY